MITNKYESPPNYQNLKQLRLRQIQEDYFPPPLKSSFDKFFKQQPVYTNTADYIHSFEAENLFHENFEVKNSVLTNIAGLCFSLIFSFFLLTSEPSKKNPDYFSWVFTLILLPIAIMCLIRLSDRQAKLTITNNGLNFAKNKISIRWEQVIATHILQDETGDDTRYQLITDYIDEDYGCCKVENFLISGHDKGYEAIAAAIEYIKNAEYFENVQCEKLASLN
jgi:hypothetical protein